MNTLHYAKVAGALLGLLGLTVGVAFLDLGWLNTPVAMSVSAVKAVLIVWFFMHLGKANSLVRLMAAAGLFWLAILFALAFSDFASRGW